MQCNIFILWLYIYRYIYIYICLLLCLSCMLLIILLIDSKCTLWYCQCFIPLFYWCIKVRLWGGGDSDSGSNEKTTNHLLQNQNVISRLLVPCHCLYFYRIVRDQGNFWSLQTVLAWFQMLVLLLFNCFMITCICWYLHFI